MFDSFVNFFIQWSVWIFVTSLVGLLLIAAFHFRLYRYWPDVQRFFGAALTWLLMLISDFVFFVIEKADKMFSNWRVRRQPVLHSFAEDIRQGKMPNSVQGITTAASRCCHCHGRRTKPYWTAADITAALRGDLERQLQEGLCSFCIGWLVVMVRKLNASAAVTPAVPVAASAQPARTGRKIDGDWFVNLIAAGIFLSLLILALASFYSGFESRLVVVKGMYYLVGIFLLVISVPGGISSARKLF